MKYRFSFIGVKIGAIGKAKQHTFSCEAENYNEAINKLYKNFDHCQKLRCNGKLMGF